MKYGIDGEMTKLPQDNSTFTFSMGVGIGVSSYEDFVEAYQEQIASVAEDRDLDAEMNVIKSYDVYRQISDQSETNVILKDIVTGLNEFIDEVRPIFSYFRGRNQITSFKQDTQTSELPVWDFHERHLGNGYEHICAWKLFEEGADEVLCDAFSGYKTRAWEILDQNDYLSNMKMLYKGDQLSPLLSVSDMMLNLIQQHFSTTNEHVYKNEVNTFVEGLGFKSQAEYLGNPFLGKITPLENSHMPTEKIVTNPLYLILKPDARQVGKQNVLYSPQGKKLQDKVSQEGGCIKFFHEERDQTLIDNSKMVYVDKAGKKDVEDFQKLGYDVQGIDIQNL